MRNGPVLLDGYVPDEDATMVQRVLDAGATILGKAVCESLCFPGQPEPHRRLVYGRTAAAGEAKDKVNDAAQDRPDPIWLGHHRREDLRA
jgi:Asp-tRNA(Asn)/Glu-tRNA(Gln) amidotransferase A subunit family amidase